MLLLLRACMFTQATEPVVIHRGFTHSIDLGKSRIYLIMALISGGSGQLRKPGSQIK
jgi:membrane-bound metal-dependent hydrolase YbcI (DUF457 family)